MLCVYQHAPTPGAPGIYRHRLLLSELVARGWHVDLVSCPINYMTGHVPRGYAGRPVFSEAIDGIAHHWVWASGRIHASRRRRALNYLTFAATATIKGATLSRPDVVWVSSPPLSLATAGAILARRFRCPLVLEVRDLWPASASAVGWLSASGRLHALLERWARRYTARADWLIVPTPGLVEPVRSLGANRVSVVPGAVTDTAQRPPVRRRVRAELDVLDNECLFLYAGALGAANNLDLLLDAARGLAPSDRVRVVLVGGGSRSEHIAQRLSSERIDAVTLLGPVSRERVLELLAASDVCLHLLAGDPVFESALPSKVLEYFGAHRPVITTVPGLPERVVLAGGGGFAPSVEALTAELRRWAAIPPGGRAAVGEASFHYGSTNFGRQRTVDRLESILTATMSTAAP